MKFFFQFYSILLLMMIFKCIPHWYIQKIKKNLEDKDERKKKNNINDNRKQTSNRIR